MLLAKYFLHICVVGFLIHVVFSRIEGRIAKLVRVEIEVVDKNVDCLVTDLKSDFNKNINEGSEVLEAALDDLKSKDLLTRDDLDKLLVKRMGSGDVEVSLDEIREFARKIVEKEIEKHAATDGLRMVDYALASTGGMVVKHSEPDYIGMVGKWFTGWSNIWRVHKDAEMMLKRSFGVSGQCFPLKGNNGFVQISLATAIFPEAITMEHASKHEQSDDIVVDYWKSAPKHCRVYGWLNTKQTTDSEDTYLLTEFTYDLEKSNVQTFKVSDNVRDVVIDTVRLYFTSNHGNPFQTCIHRLRVHGHKAAS